MSIKSVILEAFIVVSTLRRSVDEIYLTFRVPLYRAKCSGRGAVDPRGHVRKPGLAKRATNDVGWTLNLTEYVCLIRVV